jgi:hypothetical protein
MSIKLLVYKRPTIIFTTPYTNVLNLQRKYYNKRGKKAMIALVPSVVQDSCGQMP